MMLAPPETHLKPAFPKPIWMDVFGARLMQLEPSMDAVRAARHAAVTWPDACSLDPDQAAEIFARERSAADRSAPSQ